MLIPANPLALALALILAAHWAGLSSDAQLSEADPGMLPSSWGAVIPPGAISVDAGQSIQAALNAAPEGATLVIRAGMRRMQNVRPKRGQTFIGEPGAILSGARLLTSFIREGHYWVATGQTQQGQVHGICQRGVPRCMYPEDLFFDDVPLRHVAGLAEVAPGTWYFDYAADRIYFWDDPRGHRVETSVTRTAFSPTAENVTIRNLVIEKYAIPAQMGAIGDQFPRPDWVVENNLVRWNHGTGIACTTDSIVRDNTIIANGQKGLGCSGDNVLVEGNEIAWNNYARFAWGWEAGCCKFGRTTRLTVRNNHVHHNNGTGLWTDGDNNLTLYEGNVVEDNGGAGIFHEISYQATIRNNTVRRNGDGFHEWCYGAGILVAHSPGVEVYGNMVRSAYNGIALIYQGRGSGRYGPYHTRDSWIHDNMVTVEGTGAAAVVCQDQRDNSIFTSWNNRFDRNTYRVPSLSGRHWAWLNAYRTWSEWQSLGQDPNGTLQLATPP